MSMVCAYFPVTFQRLREKKEQNNVTERKTCTAQYSWEKRDGWSKRFDYHSQFPLLLPICAAWCADHMYKKVETLQRPRAALQHRALIIIYEIYYVGSSFSYLHRPLFHLSILMNRCYSAVGVNMMDWVAGRHILLLWESERGHLDSEQHAGVPWLFYVSHLFFLITTLISDIQEPFQPKYHLQYSTTHCPVHLSPCQPFCSADHLPVMCPCPQLKKPASEKVKIFVIRSTRPLRNKEGRKEGEIVEGVW